MSEELTPEQRAARRRRLAAIFGETPEQTSDDAADPREAGDASESAKEAWLKRQVPPHHG